MNRGTRPGWHNASETALSSAAEKVMMADKHIIILPAPGCRRSRKIMAYLEAQGIPFKEVELASPEGEALTRQ
jgi:hypothetical protein